MLITRLAVLGLIILVTPTYGAQGGLRRLPLLPQSSGSASKSSMGVQILKDSSQFMIKEFEDACSANISNIKSFTLDPVKPEGFGNQIQYYTQSDKIGLINNLNNLLKRTTDSVNTKLEVLDKEEVGKGTPLSNQEVLRNFREIYGILNEGRKNCALSLNQIEKQVLRTKALKECPSTLKKDSSAKTGFFSRNIKKYVPGFRDQKKDQPTESSDVNEREAPTTSSKAKKILGTKETREEERQRLLLESLEKSGLH